jgi:hypothetical protein
MSSDIGDRRRSERGRAGGYFDCIGGAIFSGGAGGRAAFAPSCCACASGRAGSGAGVVGRVPPGLDSAGVSFVVVEGEPCKGGVACARCTLVRATDTSEKPANIRPATSMTEAIRKYARLFLSFDDIAFTHEWFVSFNGCGKASFPGTTAEPVVA